MKTMISADEFIALMKQSAGGMRNLVPREGDNGHSHSRACTATHPEPSIPITEGRPYPGRGQAIMLIEFGGPRIRESLARVHSADATPPAPPRPRGDGNGKVARHG